jgi:hypothetical protein
VLAYAVVAAAFLLRRLGTSTDAISHPEIQLAAPAE